MNDLSVTIVPKSDQLNADDLIAGPITIRITRVTVKRDDQPVDVFYEGGERKPYKPCKSMRRVMVHAWGPDANTYAGRAMTLYRDPDVKWAGEPVGGIRISHLSHIDQDLRIALTETRGKRSPFIVRPIRTAAEQKATASKTEAWVEQHVLRIGSVQTLDDLHQLASDAKVASFVARLRGERPDLADRIQDAERAAIARLDPPAGDGNSDDGWPGAWRDGE